MKQIATKNNKLMMSVAAGIVLICVLIIIIMSKGLGKGSNNAIKPTGEVIATSKYGKVYRSELDDALQLLSAQAGGEIEYDKLNADDIKTLVNSIVAQRALLAKAKESTVIQDVKFQKAIQALEENLMKETYLRDLASKEITEEKMKERYDLVSKEVIGQKEYGVRRILLNSEEEAKKLMPTLTRLTFANAAKKHSKDRETAARGGDLGMVLLKSLDPDLAKVVEKTRVGRISEPFNTRFGWNIIMVYRIRDAELPSYKDSEEKLKEALFNELVREELNQASQDAEVKILGEEKK